jgi:hypothetical protein
MGVTRELLRYRTMASFGKREGRGCNAPAPSASTCLSRRTPAASLSVRYLPGPSLRCSKVVRHDVCRQGHNARAYRDHRDNVVRGHLALLRLASSPAMVGPRGGSHVAVVGLARVVRTFLPLLPMLLHSLAPYAHLRSFTPLFPSLVLPLVALCILRYPKQFLEVLGLFVALFCESASLWA